MYMRAYIYFVSFLLWSSHFLCIDCRTSPTNSSRCFTDILPCGHSLWWILEHQDSGSGSVFYYHSELDIFIDFWHFICFAYSWIFEVLSLIWILVLLLLGSFSILQGHDLFSFPYYLQKQIPFCLSFPVRVPIHQVRTLWIYFWPWSLWGYGSVLWYVHC